MEKRPILAHKAGTGSWVPPWPVIPHREVPDKMKLLSLSLNPCVPIIGHGLKGAMAHPYLVAYVDKLS